MLRSNGEESPRALWILRILKAKDLVTRGFLLFQNYFLRYNACTTNVAVPMAIDQEIERYVRDERSREVGEDDIRHSLIAKGWDYKLVDDIIAETRPGPVSSLFTRSFFRFAFGFIAIIVVAVGVILVVGTISQGGVDKTGCVLNCGHD